MNDYKAAMDKIVVDPAMESRVLAKVEQATAAPAAGQRVPRSRALMTAAACLVLMLGLSWIISQPGRINGPEVQPPPVAANTPMATANSLDELQDLFSFTLCAPAKLPPGYAASSFAAINGEIAQIDYQGADGEIIYRTAVAGQGSISGDYNVYQTVLEQEIGGYTVSLSLNGVAVCLAEWEADGLAFSLSFSNGIDQVGCAEIIQSIGLAE